MSDTKLSQYIQYGTTAERLAFTPDPPLVGGNPVQTLYMWYDTDTSEFYVWDGAAWVLIGGGSAVTTTFHPFMLMGAL